MITVIDLQNLATQQAILATLEAVSAIGEGVGPVFLESTGNTILVLVPQSMPHPSMRKDLAQIAEIYIRYSEDEDFVPSIDEHELLAKYSVLLTEYGFWWGPDIRVEVQDFTPPDM